jgi:hypothetical protein
VSRRSLLHALTGLLAWSLVTATLVGVGSSTAHAKVPKAAFRYTAAIEPLANYVGQSTCSPGAKPGTTAFANLLLRTYPSSRSLGISRACGVGGKSEHKEGRAFDWGVSVNKAKDRASVRALMKWLLKRDAYGNRYAMARRLGIQYMIWNRRIWGAYAAGRGWRKYTGSNPHTDHVHFSLSWAGARKKTSFWSPRDFPNRSGSAPSKPSRPKAKPRPKPAPDRPPNTDDRRDWPDPRPDERDRGPRALPEPRSPRTLSNAAPLVVERLNVSARRKAGTRTRKALVEGRRYLIEVSGTYRYDRDPGSLADAECSTRDGADWWQRERSLRHEDWDADHLDLYVDGHDLYAESDDAQSCDSEGHTYRWVYEAERTGRVPFAVWDPNGFGDNAGRLTVRVLDLGAERDTMSWKVPARSRAGATSPGLLRGGQEYRVTVSGTWRNGDGVTSDAECTRGWDDGWRRDGDSYDMVVGDWGYDSLAPRLSGVRTEPVSGAPECDDDHRYSYVFTPDHSTPLNIRVGDPGGHGDNTGALRVAVKPYDPSQPAPAPSPSPSPEPTPEPTPLPEPEPTIPAEHLSVDSRSADRVRTEQDYPAGTTLRVTSTGMYFMHASQDGWIVADAECTITSGDRDWRSTRFEGEFDGRTSPLGDLVVNGEIVTWQPADGRGSCDSGEHTYTYDVTVEEDGPLWFVIADDHYDDNRGALEVEVAVR